MCHVMTCQYNNNLEISCYVTLGHIYLLFLAYMIAISISESPLTQQFPADNIAALLNDNHLQVMIKHRIPSNHTFSITKLAFDGSGEFIASVGADGSVSVKKCMFVGCAVQQTVLLQSHFCCLATIEQPRVYCMRLAEWFDHYLHFFC